MNPTTAHTHSHAPEAPDCGAYDHRQADAQPLDPEQLGEAAQMFSALAEPTRLKLLLDLAAGERCVTELVHSQQDTLSALSARLQVLYDARLVKRRRDDKHLYYSLADDHVLVLLRNVLAHSAEAF